MEVITKVEAPNPKASTLRTIIPREAVSILGIHKGDSVKWSFKIHKQSLEVHLEKCE